MYISIDNLKYNYAYQSCENDNPIQPRVNIVKVDDIIVGIITEVNMVTYVNEWVIDYEATRHISGNKYTLQSYTKVMEKKCSSQTHIL